MKLRFLNNQLQYQNSKGDWTKVPQAIEIIDLKAEDSYVYYIGNNVFIGGRGIFVLNKNVAPVDSCLEKLGVVKKEIDTQLRAAIFGLIDPGRRKDVIFNRDGFVTEIRNEELWLVGFYKSDDDPSFYLIKDAINGLRPRSHCPYHEGHVFSPDYNPVIGEYEVKQTNIGPLADPLYIAVYDPIGDSGPGVELYTKDQVRRIFDCGVAEALSPHSICIGSVFDKALEQERINPLTKKTYTIEIRLNQRVPTINFTTGVRLVNDVDFIRLSMQPHDFLNTFLDWHLVKSIRVVIDK